MTAEMQQYELQRILEDYNNDATRAENVPQELDDYLKHVAKTGHTIFKWSQIKLLYSEKLKQAIKLSKEHSTPLSEIPTHPNIEPFCFETMESLLQSRLEFFVDPPFTIQRLTELLLSPRKNYTRLDKYMRAVEKNVMVANMQIIERQSIPAPEDETEEERRRVVAEILASRMFYSAVADGSKRRAVEVEEPTPKKAKLGALDNIMSCDEHANLPDVIEKENTSDIDVVGVETTELHRSSKRNDFTNILNLASDDYTKRRHNNPTKHEVPARHLHQHKKREETITKPLEDSHHLQPTEQEEPCKQTEVPIKQEDETATQAKESDEQTLEKQVEKIKIQSDEPNNEVDETASQAKESVEPKNHVDETTPQAKETTLQTDKTDKRGEVSAIYAREPGEQVKEELAEKSSIREEAPATRTVTESLIIAKERKVTEDMTIKEVKQVSEEPNAGLKEEAVKSNSPKADNSNSVISLSVSGCVIRGESVTNHEMSVSNTAAASEAVTEKTN